MLHDSLEGGYLALKLLDFRTVGIVAALLGRELLEESLHLEAGLVVLLHEGVVFQIHLLIFILREVGVELVELVGEQQTVVGQQKAVGLGTGVVDLRGAR